MLRSKMPLLLLWLLLLAACRTEQPPPTPIIVGEVASNILKIEITADGLYQLTAEQLQQAGLDIVTLSPDALALTDRGTAVPYLLHDNRLIFYGQASDNRYTNQRVYLLQTGQSGQPMATADSAITVVARPFDHVNRTLHLEENLIYEPTARTPFSNNADVWYWAKIGQRQQLPLQFELPAVNDGSGTLTINLLGLTQNAEIEDDHDLDLILNGRHLGTVRWDGETSHTASLDLPSASLQSGTNDLVLDNEVAGAAFLDIMQLNWIEISYSAPNAIPQDTPLDFIADDAPTYLSSSQRPLLFDISDPANPHQLLNWEYVSDQARFRPLAGAHIIATLPDGLPTPRLTPFRQSDWRNPAQQADLIILTTDELLPALTPLVDARRAQGLSVAPIPVGEIYDAFGDGYASPESIQAFVTYAYTEWENPPRYLFVVGDATTDHRDYLGLMPRNHVPSFIVPVQFGGETVSDSRLVDVDGDMKPDLAIGRWPVSTVAEVESLVSRTLAYESGTASPTTLFATDGTEPQFATIAERLSHDSQLPAATTTLLNAPQAADVVTEWNAGTWLTTYIGHGSIERWGKDDIFFPAAVSDLNSTNPPIVLQLTCLTGLFAHPEIPSLSETMLTHKNGPVLLIAATSLTLSNHQEPFAQSLLQALQNPANPRIGDAFQLAKASLPIENNDGLREISDTFALIGDPSALIIRPMNNEQ